MPVIPFQNLKKNCW